MPSNSQCLEIGSLRRLELAGMTSVAFSAAYASIFPGAIRGYNGHVDTRCVIGVLRDHQSLNDLIACSVGPHAIALVLFDALNDIPGPKAMPRHVIENPSVNVRLFSSRLSEPALSQLELT